MKRLPEKLETSEIGCRINGKLKPQGDKMKNLQLKIVRNVLFAAVMFCTGANQASPRSAQSEYKNEVWAGIEEIYVFRTTRTDLKRGATRACAAAPFASASEQDFDLWSIDVRGADGRVVNTHKSGVGAFTGCFSQPAQDHSLQMYATGTVAHVPWVGVGECIVPKAQPPVRTVAAYTCRLDLSGLPEKYFGGLLVSSTLTTLLRDQPSTALCPATSRRLS
jgi:hypothetical protein